MMSEWIPLLTGGLAFGLGVIGWNLFTEYKNSRYSTDEKPHAIEHDYSLK